MTQLPVPPAEAGRASAPTLVANMVPTGFVLSTGNLYWTANTWTGAPPFRFYRARVYRAGKSNVPGAEVLLYEEKSLSPVSFGNITFANVHGVWYGYFVATYSTESVIKRVPLDGSSGAVTVDDSRGLVRPESPLLTDGTNLYFTDANGIYYAPLRGSTAYVVVETPGVTAFGFDTLRVYYAAGGTLSSSRKDGSGHTYLLKTQSTPITGLSVKPGANGNVDTLVVYTDGVSVLSYKIGGSSFGGGPVAQLPFEQVTSVAWGGNHGWWTVRNVGTNKSTANWRQEVDAFYGRWPITDGAHSIQADAAQFFYIGSTGFYRMRYVA